MLFIAVTVAFGVLMYLFVQRVVVMKPVGVKGVDEAIDALIERHRVGTKRGDNRGRKRARSWESASLSEHTMEIIDSLEATTCPTEVHSAAANSTAVSMGSQASKEASTALEFDKTFDPKDAAAKQEEGGEKKAHRKHHHKRHHRHRSRAEEKERERSSDSGEGSGGSEEAEEEERKSKAGHKRHRKHRSRDVVSGPRLDTPLLVAGETLPGPDVVDVEMRSMEALKSP